MEVQSVIRSEVRASSMECSKNNASTTVKETNDQKSTEPVSKKDFTVINTDGDTLEISPYAARSYKNDTNAKIFEAAAVKSTPNASEAAAVKSTPKAPEAAVAKSTPKASEAAVAKSTPKAPEAAVARSTPNASEAAVARSTPKASEAAAAKNAPKLTATALSKYSQSKLKQLLADKQITKRQYDKALKSGQQHEEASPEVRADSNSSYAGNKS